MGAPQRIQRKRTKGWRMPPGAVSVTRPGKFGNPFKTAAEFRWLMRAPQSEILDRAGSPAAGLALVMYRERIKRDIGELRGRDLACWCKIGAECHGDVLLDLANPTP